MTDITHNSEALRLEQTYGAKNYNPLPVVLVKGEGVWVWDEDGNRYLDMLSAYSALNQGHRHPKIIAALKDQADRITLTSRAFYNDKLGIMYERLAKLTGKDMILPMNTGAEAVETAIKAARRWAYDIKHVPRTRQKSSSAAATSTAAQRPLFRSLRTPNTNVASARSRPVSGSSPTATSKPCARRSRQTPQLSSWNRFRVKRVSCCRGGISARSL
ncbi:hypothetical protein GCM10025858_21340 [Alicyclobacillus sacchari]|nr:hypothetical protein GCM10025858_21340 [Alicyclobacillus sacchari]